MRPTTRQLPSLLAALALFVALPACGDDETKRDLDDAADKVQQEGKEAGKDVEGAAKDLDKETGIDEDAEREGKEAVDDVEDAVDDDDRK